MTYKSPAIENLLSQYLHSNIGGKVIRCPYWEDKIDKKIYGPFGGKGKPGQIIQVTIELAQKQNFDFQKSTPIEIEDFMKKNRIGVDCSGLAYWLLDALDREKGGNGLEDDILGVKGKFLTRASVEMLTNDEISTPIKTISEVVIGDMIRLRAGKHMAIVIRIKRAEGKIKELIYAHSSKLTETRGVHVDRILVKDPQKGLADQTWMEKTSRGENYGQKYFHSEEGDGIRRLKVPTQTTFKVD